MSYSKMKSKIGLVLMIVSSFHCIKHVFLHQFSLCQFNVMVVLVSFKVNLCKTFLYFSV